MQAQLSTLPPNSRKTDGTRRRKFYVRSIACQVNPNNFPGFRKFAITETESQYTGVHFKENYAAVRANFIIPTICPELELRPNERNDLAGRIQQLPRWDKKPSPRMKFLNLNLNSSGAKQEEADAVEIPEEEEEKYVGPRLHDGAIPEMIVSSGALGMTSTTKQRAPVMAQRAGKRAKRPEDEDPDWSPADSSKPSTSSSHRRVTTGSVNDILRSIESQFPHNIESYYSEEEKKRFRYREIGRIICEIGLGDFVQDNNRKGHQIALRGEDMLISVKRNLTVIRDKLGEHAKGTIFDHVDELVASFATATPNGLARLSEAVSEKIERREGNIADALEGLSGEQPFEQCMEMRDVKQEEFDVKVEEPDYTDNYDF